jgi:molecular chaperone GrpE
VRKLAAGLVGRLRQLCDERIQQAAEAGSRRDGAAQEALTMTATALADAGQGLELVLLRTRRLMEQAGLRRIDVLHEPFDAERMRAIETLEEPTIPEGHVARQFRPGYLLHGAVLRPAEVGVSR